MQEVAYKVSVELLEKLIDVLASRQTIYYNDDEYNDNEVIEVYEKLSDELFNQGWNIDD